MSVIGSNALAGASGQGGGGYEIERSLRFNDADDASLSFTPSSAGNRKTWTWSSWVKLNNDGYQNLFANLVNNSNGLYVYWSNGVFYINDYNISGGAGLNTTRVFRDFSSWYHIVIAMDSTQATASDRVKLYINGVQETLAGSQPSQNVDGQWNAAQTHYIGQQSNNIPDYNLDGYLADVHFIDGQGLAASDFGEFDNNNVWQPKEYEGTYNSAGYSIDHSGTSTVSNASTLFDGSSSSYATQALSGGSYQTVTTVPITFVTGSFTYNTNNGGATGGSSYRYLRLTKQSDNSTIELTVTNTNGWTIPSAWRNIVISKIEWKRWSSYENVSAVYVDGVMLVDAVIPAGVNGFHLDFSDNSSDSALGTDSSGNGNNWTVNNLSVASGADNDSLRDSPTNGDPANDTGAGGELSGNYATFNPLFSLNSPSTSEGNLKVATSSSGVCHIGATIAFPTSGKWYLEVTQDSGTYGLVGVIGTENTFSSSTYLYQYDESYVMYKQSGALLGNNSGSSTGSGSTFTNGDCIGIALDMDNQQLRFYKNNTQLGGFNSVTTSKRLVFAVSDHDSSSSTFTLNTGSKAFKYNAPSGFKCLCTANLPDPTIADGSTAFDGALWTGTGYPASSAQTISGLNMSPDLVWIKNRTQAKSHRITDTVRGATKTIYSDNNGAEATESSSLTAFTSDGFTVGTESAVNGDGNAIVGWAWDAGSSTVTNTDGTISAQVRANPSAGFSIVKWTTPTVSTGDLISVAHGLNQVPGFVITKSLNNSDHWYTAHGFDLSQFAKLDSTDAFSNAGAAWGGGFTSTVFGMRAGNFTATSYEHVAYCFAPVEGYSAFGSYEGNGSNDGMFVYTGFSVRWLLTKASSHGSDWQLWDTTRQPHNQNANTLAPNSSSQETGTSGYAVDLLSNGFKFRMYGSSSNQSNYTYIWAAFAEHPFKTARAR